MSHLQALAQRQIAHPPAWMSANLQYETIMGSSAYGVATDASDCDLYGYAIPPKELVFPHTQGEIPGFGRQTPRFEQYQEHHLTDPHSTEDRARSYDFSIYGIVKYFQLAMENNPNILDSLFAPDDMVTHQTSIAGTVRARRRLFLHKGAWPKFKGYAHAQLRKLTNKTPIGKRAKLVAAHGYDTKYAYHLVRLLGEVEQILTEGDIDLRRNATTLKFIRQGNWPEADLRAWVATKEAELDQVYLTSSLRHSPDEAAIRQLLLDCLEQHYGSLKGLIGTPE